MRQATQAVVVVEEADEVVVEVAVVEEATRPEEAVVVPQHKAVVEYALPMPLVTQQPTKRTQTVPRLPAEATVPIAVTEALTHWTGKNAIPPKRVVRPLVLWVPLPVPEPTPDKW